MTNLCFGIGISLFCKVLKSGSHGSLSGICRCCKIVFFLVLFWEFKKQMFIYMGYFIYCLCLVFNVVYIVYAFSYIHSENHEWFLSFCLIDLRMFNYVIESATKLNTLVAIYYNMYLTQDCYSISRNCTNLCLFKSHSRIVFSSTIPCDQDNTDAVITVFYSWLTVWAMYWCTQLRLYQKCVNMIMV